MRDPKEPVWWGVDFGEESPADRRALYFGTFTATESPLEELAGEYYRRTEEYDLTVCTGPMGLDGILPASGHEFILINRNAAAVRHELVDRASRLGFTDKQFHEAMRQHARHQR